MKRKTKRILEKAIKVCSDCGKEFLPIIINSGCEDEQYYILHIRKYNLKCNKCPNCAEKCYTKHREYIDEYNFREDSNFIDKINQLKCPENIFSENDMIVYCLNLYIVCLSSPFY